MGAGAGCTAMHARARHNIEKKTKNCLEHSSQPLDQPDANRQLRHERQQQDDEYQRALIRCPLPPFGARELCSSETPRTWPRWRTSTSTTSVPNGGDPRPHCHAEDGQVWRAPAPPYAPPPPQALLEEITVGTRMLLAVFAVLTLEYGRIYT